MSETIRMLDANLNRAREALRVMEDVARFILSDASLAGAIKVARHDLRPIAEAAGLDQTMLAAWRDTPGDVGTGITTTSERGRASIRDVSIAAGKRAGEALRVIEETCKLVPSKGEQAADGLAKNLRYRVYDLEKRLVMELGAFDERSRQWTLCVLITESLCGGRAWQDVAKAAIKGGADCLQLREKTLESRELAARARALVDICRGSSAAVIINDRVDIALLAGADGVHVGQTDLSIADVRRLAGRSLIVGISTANMEQARAAAREGADYCGCGPMFPTTTKHKPVLSGPGYMREYLADPETSRVPHLAISGITPTNARELAAIGCKGIAVSSAVCEAVDPERACRELREAMSASGAP